MIDKEIGEIRRHIRRDRSNMPYIYGCYVNENKEIISEFRLSTALMTENEGEKYFGLLKRSLSGTLGKNLIDISFQTFVLTSFFFSFAVYFKFCELLSPFKECLEIEYICFYLQMDKNKQ